MSEREIKVYCDASISGNTLKGYESHITSDYVGRIMVVVPELDYGLLERFYDDLALPNGHENVLHAEVVAIRRANEVCGAKGKEFNRRFVIYSDNSAAIDEIGLSHVKLIRPEERHIADAYLKAVRFRCSYLRRSSENVRKRKPENARQLEITRLMSSERMQFRLSESPLFKSFEMAGIPRSYQ